MHELIQSYLDECELRGLSPVTIKNYGIVLERWVTYSGIPGDRLSAQRFLARSAQPRTRLNVWRIVKCFIRWLADQGQGEDWTRRITVKCPQKEDYVILEKQDVTRIIDGIENENTWLRERNRTLIKLMFSTALRNSEIRLIKVSDIDWAKSEIRVKIKGGRYINSHLNDYARGALLDWVIWGQRDYLFPSVYADKPLNRESLIFLIKEAARKAGLRDRVTPHVFRRAAATALIRDDVPLEVVQKVLHHRSIATTMIYARLADTKAAEAQDRVLSL